ncbi:MAG TPA: flagellar biosynthesis protein FlhF [Caldimonas sp.]|jgi:flagellar biosynthesis protein FlhF|nr:flagellar biosynthesis protein FlhF [Caldimonas sp.]HEX2541110.1 flagellar biosynthesis protein FlhF [Caldimonas sp.]
MSVKRFTARTSREAFRLVREALGDDAIVLSTKPSAGGVEVLAMAPEGVGRIEQMAATAPANASPRQVEADLGDSSAEQDAARLEMSTLSFQDYVRKRMLKRRAEAIEGQAAPLSAAAAAAAPRAASTPLAGAAAAPTSRRLDVRLDDPMALPGTPAGRLVEAEPSRAGVPAAEDALFEPPASLGHGSDLLSELRSVKGLIEERFGMLAFLERLQRRPAEARLTQKLLDCGFSPILVRKLADGLGADVVDENDWAAQVLERNLQAAESGEAIEDRGGVFALIGATGVGKTTTAAKIAAAFAAKHGAGHLGLITLDAYRVGAHEQLRAYGRILGVPVHTAHDRASLDDLLELLSAKKMILIDTAGMAQRDSRTRELLDMLSHRSVQRLLVVNAAAQGETIEDVLLAYRAGTCAGMVLSKLDEAVKLGPALDAAIRHKLKIVGVANGQRVPEDWHRLSSSALVQRALRGGGSAAWRLDSAEMSLIFSAPRQAPADTGAIV